MTWLDTVRTAVDAIFSHRLRSALTMLGILIGVSAVMLTVGLGEGASSSVDAAIQALGSNVLTVTPGSTTSSSGLRGGLGSSTTLTEQDADALADRKYLPDVAAVAPIYSESEVLTNGSTNWTTTVVGSDASWETVRGRTMEAGAFFTSADVKDSAAVAVLGPTTSEELFGAEDPVGDDITVDGQTFTVVGVMSSVGSTSSSTSDQDDQVIVPLTAGRALVFGGGDTVSSILLQATSKSTLSAAYQEADTELLNLHDITDAANADFTITADSSILSTSTSVDKTLTILLGGIAAISLLVGGIGVMNIMLVSVTERIREIGLRKALGATPAIILRQFLVEAGFLGVIGGVLGVALGVGGALALPHLISDTIVISKTAAAAAIAVSLGIGLGFGVYPASRAARLAPIDALRSE